jgi:peptidoglycan/LPS O-acetylase OafA/YrhL
MAIAIALTYWLFAFVICLFVYFDGDRTAKLGSLLFLCASVISAIAQATNGGWSQGINWPLLICDLAHFIGLFALAVYSKRYWPIWASGFQFLTVITVVSIALAPGTSYQIYRGLETVWAIPVLLVMLIGERKDRRIVRTYRQA